MARRAEAQLLRRRRVREQLLDVHARTREQTRVDPVPLEDRGSAQVLNTNGKWVGLDAPPGSIVLNTGDYLQRISNDRLPSTTHRVQPAARSPAGCPCARRFPLATYLAPDELLEVLPGLGEPRYEPIRVITFHTRTTAKFYGDDYAVEAPGDHDPRG